MGTESEDKKRSPSLLIALVGASIVLVPCLYCGSIGPVVRYLDKPALQPVWRVVYAPLEWAHRKTPLERPLEAYVGLWTDLAPGPGD